MSNPKIVKNSYFLSQKSGAKLEIEIEYQLTEKGYINNNCEAQYIITNVGTIPISCSNGDDSYVIFEFFTSDGKVIEAANGFCDELQPGKTSTARTVSVNAGLNRFCTSVKATRMGRL